MPTLTLKQLQRALALAEQIQRLEEEFQALVGGQPEPPANGAKLSVPQTGGRTRGRGGRRSFSEETRAKMAAAQQARWAQRKGNNSTAATRTSAPAARKKKRELTPEGRARIAAALKARWEKARKTGGPAPNARKKK